MVGWCRHTSTVQCQQAALTLGPGAFTRRQSCRAEGYIFSALEEWQRHWLYELGSSLSRHIRGSVLRRSPGSSPRINAKIGQGAWC